MARRLTGRHYMVADLLLSEVVEPQSATCARDDLDAARAVIDEMRAVSSARVHPRLGRLVDTVWRPGGSSTRATRREPPRSSLASPSTAAATALVAARLHLATGCP